jgi:VanZ family protein
MATDEINTPQFTGDSICFETASMSFSARAARYARVTPSKLHVALPLLFMAVLYWLSSLPVTPTHDPALYGLFNRMPSSVQNALHVPAYAALAWAWYWVLGAWLRVPGARAISACAIASAYGVFDEWHQSFVPGRYASLTDFTLDVAGVVLGIWLAAWIGSSARTIKSQITKDKINPKI